VRTLLTVVILALWTLAAAQDFEWRDVVQEVRIGPDGTVTVRDARTLGTDEDFAEAFICIQLGEGQRVTLLEGGALSPGPDAEAFQQPCEGGQELVVRQEARVSQRRVFFEYRLEGTVTAYSDVVAWYWNVLEPTHPPVRGYDLTVTAPGPMEAPYDAFVHRYGNPEEPRVTLSDDRRELRVAFSSIPDGSGVEVRYLIDPALFTLRGTEPGLEELLRDEARIAGLDAARRNPWLGVLGLPLVLGLLGGIVRAYRRRGAAPQAMRYPFEPPADRPPAAAALLASRLSPSLGNAFHATIMDLARRGYGAFDGRGREFNMHLDVGRDTSDLLPFERSVLDFLKQAAQGEDSDYLDFRELKRYSEKHLAKFMAAWEGEVRGWLEGELGGPRLDPRSRRAAGVWAALAFLGTGLCAFGAVLTLGLAQMLFFLCALLAFALAFVAIFALPTWRAEVAPEAHGWMGFRRTLSDYTRMKDAPDDFFRLWDRYYCYAAALGVARRFLRNLQRAAPLRGLDEGALAHRAAWMGEGVSSTRNLAALSGAVTSLSSALSAAGASASSGGSVSGGGGGGGAGSSSGGR